MVHLSEVVSYIKNGESLITGIHRFNYISILCELSSFTTPQLVHKIGD